MDKKYLIIAAVAVTVLAACVVWFGFYDNSSKSLAGDVKEFSSRCPIELVPGNIIESMTYDKDANTVIASISVSSHIFASSDSARHASDLTLFFQDFENRRLLKDMVKADASLTLRYEVFDALNPELDSSDLDLSQVVISSDELSAIESEPLLDGRQRAILALPSLAIELNQLCPLAWSKGAELVGVEVDDDEDMLCLYIYAQNVATSDKQRGIFRKELKDNRRKYPQVMAMVSEIASAGYGIKVRYLDDDKITVAGEMDILPQDIYNISQLR